MKQFIQTHKLLCIVLACVLVAGITCAIVLPIALKHEHTYATEWTTDETNHWHAATCEHTEEVKDKAAHEFDDGEITAPATEEAAGVKTFTCKTCGYKKTESIKQLEHTHKFETEWTTDEANHWHAATCEHTEERRDFGEHKGEWTIKTEADYGVDKVEERTCTVCGKYQEKTIENSALAAKDNTVLVGTIDFTYNANSQPIDGFVTAGNVEGMVIEYEGRSYTSYEKTTTAPTNAGLYKYTITIPETAEWKAAEISGEFWIKRYFITEVEGKYSKEYNGSTVIDVPLDSEKYKGLSVQIYFKSKDVGAEIQRILINGVGKDNYDVDQSKVKAEIVAKKLTNLKFEIEEANVDTMVSEQTITRKIAGVKDEEIEVEITFDPNELINEDALELSFDGKGGATCIIKFKTENPNYELDLTLGELILKKSATV